MAGVGAVQVCRAWLARGWGAAFCAGRVRGRRGGTLIVDGGLRAGSGAWLAVCDSVFAGGGNTASPLHPESNPGANLNSISHRCFLREVAFEWELTKETIYLPLGCLQGGHTVLITWF